MTANQNQKFPFHFLPAPASIYCRKGERGRDSLLTGGVLVSHVLGAELLKNMGEPFRIPHASRAVGSLLFAQQKSHLEKCGFLYERRVRDSNPRDDCSPNTLAGCPIRPLWQLSVLYLGPTHLAQTSLQYVNILLFARTKKHVL